MRSSIVLPAAALIPAAAANFHDLAVAAGKLYFGSATDNGELTDEPYVAILSNTSEYGQITPGNGQKWQYTEPTRGQFDYASGDEIVDFAQTNGQSIVRCHTLVWHSQLPDWVSSGSWTADELTEIIQTHISNVAGHYAGQCYSWDVVNEALDEDGTMRDSVFSQVMGTDFLGVAFKAAAEADPDAKLYYNDYNLEWAGDKSAAVIDTIIPAIQDAGARIDGVGCQAHLQVGNTPPRADLASTLESYIAAGVTEVAYTELDIRFPSLPADEAGLAQQGDDFAAVVGACLDVEGCVGVTVWDITDKYSWIPDVFPGEGAALLYDEDLEKKPAWTSVSSVLAAAAATAAP